MNDTYEMWERIFKTRKITKKEAELIQEHMKELQNAMEFFRYALFDPDCFPECGYADAWDEDAEDYVESEKILYLHLGEHDYINLNIIDNEEENKC